MKATIQSSTNQFFDYVSKSFCSICVVYQDKSSITGRRLLRHKYICYFRFEKKVMEGLFFGYKLIIMGEELLIRDAVLFLQEEIQFRHSLSLKLCHQKQIFKFHDFQWTQKCRRWQRNKHISIPRPSQGSLQLQVYYQSEEHIPIVIGEGIVHLENIVSHLGKQIKIVLMYDGILVGNLYCKFAATMEQDNIHAKTFLYLHKIDITMLEDYENIFSINLTQNGSSIFRKEFHLQQRNKALFPNLKVPVLMSDVIAVTFAHQSLQIRQIHFQIDTIKRGKTSFYQVWLRNRQKKKVGDLKLQYFMENLYLQNQRQVFTRNGIYVGSFRNPSGLLALNDIEKDKLRKSVIIRQIVQADRRILKINRSVRRLIKNIDVEDRKSSFCQQPTANNSKLRG